MLPDLVPVELMPHALLWLHLLLSSSGTQSAFLPLSLLLGSSSSSSSSLRELFSWSVVENLLEIM